MTYQPTKMRAPLNAKALGLLLWSSVVQYGCDESGPRVYTAQRFSPEVACLEAYAPLGLVEAKDLGALCEPVCLSQDVELFVSSVCPPYPTEASLEAADAEGCAAALAAPSCDDLEPTELVDAAVLDAADAAAP